MSVSSGTGSPGQSRTKGSKTIVVVVVLVVVVVTFLLTYCVPIEVPPLTLPDVN